MKPKLGKLLTASLVLVCILIFASLPQTIAALATPKIYVEPKTNAFRTDTTSVGDTFTINISTSGWEAPGLFSYELKLYFDPTLLNATSAAYPAGHFLPPPNFEVPINVTEANVNGYVVFAVSKLGDVPGSTGSGVLGTITFKIIKAPPPALSCNLELKDMILLDPAGNEASAEVEHGYYEFTPPKTPVYLKVTPEIIGAATVGAKVRVDITINKLRAEDKLVALEWKLEFDDKLLEVSNATEGNFLRSEAEEAAAETGKEYGTAFYWVHDEGKNFTISFNLYWESEGKWEVFPEGSGTLATITFKTIHMPEELKSTDLTVKDVVMLDVNGNEISYDRVESGKYMAPTEPGDLNYDKKINILDLYIFGAAFGSYPGHPRWDARADLNGDGKVNILDGVIIAKAFHT